MKKKISDFKKDKDSEISTNIGFKLKQKSASPVKLLHNEFEVINNVKQKVFDVKNNQALFNVVEKASSKSVNNSSVISEIVTFCKRILK